jgi:hypothetical protein
MAGLTGGCLCGAVRYEASGEPIITGHCQCLDCRKSSGSGHCTHVAMMDSGFTVTGTVKLYDKPADSGNIVSRGFCPDCGAPLFSRNRGTPGMVFLRASSLDDPDLVHPSMVVYASRSPSWDRTDPSLPTFATMPKGGAKRALAEHG